MHARGRQQRRDRCVFLIHTTIRENDKGVALGDGGARLLAQCLQRPRQTRATFRDREQHRQRHRLETGSINMADLGEFVVVEHRGLELDLTTTRRGRIEQIRLRPDAGRHLGHQFLANAIERRIGYLGEELLEIVIQQPWSVGKNSQCRIRTHGAHRLLALQGHGRHKDTQVLMGIAKDHLALEHRSMVRLRHMRRPGQGFQRHEVLLQPLLVGMRGGIFLLEFGIVDDAALGRVHQENTAGVQTLLDEHIFRWDVEHTDLGGHDHEAVLGDVIT